MKRAINARDVSVLWTSPEPEARTYRFHAYVTLGRPDAGQSWDDVDCWDVTTEYGDPVDEAEFWQRRDVDGSWESIRERLVEAAIADRDAEAEDARERAAEEHEDAP